MADAVRREPARDPQDLERLLVSRERAGDVDGMAVLYEPHAVLDCGDGQLMLGREAIRALRRTGGKGSKSISGINARPLSVETWHSLQLVLPTAA
jgi:hypothetical protein